MLLLRLGVYPYEYIDDWQEFNEKSLPEEKDYYNRLNMGDITKLIQTIFKTKSLGEHHDLYIHSDTLLLTNIFDNFPDICVLRYMQDPARQFFSPMISMVSSLKKKKK